ALPGRTGPGLGGVCPQRLAGNAHHLWRRGLRDHSRGVTDGAGALVWRRRHYRALAAGFVHLARAGRLPGPCAIRFSVPDLLGPFALSFAVRHPVLSVAETLNEKPEVGESAAKMSEDRGRCAGENRRTGGGGLRTEVEGRKTEIRRQKQSERSQPSRAGSPRNPWFKRPMRASGLHHRTCVCCRPGPPTRRRISSAR